MLIPIKPGYIVSRNEKIELILPVTQNIINIWENKYGKDRYSDGYYGNSPREDNVFLFTEKSVLRCNSVSKVDYGFKPILKIY
jgi:hypothetical protein